MHVNLSMKSVLTIQIFKEAGVSGYRLHKAERYDRWENMHKDISFIYSFKDNIGHRENMFNLKD